MKQEIIGYVERYNGSWCLKTDKDDYYNKYVVFAIDELLENNSRYGDKFKITIEKLN